MVSSVFKGRAQVLDLGNIVNRDPIGLTPQVKSSFKILFAPPNTGVGIKGFEITQYNLRYQMFYHDDSGNDVAQFNIIVSGAQPYLHREKGIGIAQKAHILILMTGAMEENTRGQLKSSLYRLEQACFDYKSGATLNESVGFQKQVDGSKVISHIGLRFPSDIDWNLKPEPHIYYLEWAKGLEHFIIDNSGIQPCFIKKNINTPHFRGMLMTRDEAKFSVNHIRDFASKFDSSLNILGNLTGFWTKAESVAEWQSVIAHPAP